VSLLDLLSRARDWAAHDPDPETVAELRALADAAERGDEAAATELAERFSGPLEFGTAGLRGVLGAGLARMNEAVVVRTAHGLATWLLEEDRERAQRVGVVVGYDGRRKSRALAARTAEVLLASGVRVHLTTDLCPTPLVAFAVKELGAAAGVMVTASHNPPEYNGFKVYAATGSQIVPPVDARIAAAIDAAPAADRVPRAPADGAAPLGPDMVERYERAVLGLVARPGGIDRAFPIAYTALHGVGDRSLRRVLAAAGFTRVHTTPAQAEPDGAFPTVAFPNPEEKGALDLVYETAREHGADLVVANDPDADRLSVAVRRGDGFVQLTGNQVGVLLGHFALEEAGGAPERLVVTTVVSSPQLGAIARALGVGYEETLTGFKWITARAMERERDGARFVFGYEEALGYTVGTAVRDKDGIGAALVLCELAARCRAEGRDLFGELERIARRFGFFASRQVSITRKGSEGAREIAGMMDALRASPPAALGGLTVEAFVDRGRGVRRAGGAESPVAGPRSNVISLELAGGPRVVARPSGTEPKIKFYLDAREPLAAGEPVADAEARATARMDAMWADLAACLSLAPEGKKP